MRRPHHSLLAALGATFLGGCTQHASLADAFSSHYVGFTEVSPKLSPEWSGTDFTYTPGTQIQFYAAPIDEGSSVLVATTDLRCGPSVPFSTLPYWNRRPYKYSTAGGSKAQSAAAWLAARTGADVAKYVGITDILVEVTDVRSYYPRNDVWQRLKSETDRRCRKLLPLAATSRYVRGVIVGTLRLKFVADLSLGGINQLTLSNDLTLAFGVQLRRSKEFEFEGKNVVFGVRLN